MKGLWELAIADFTEAIRLDSKDARSYDLRGCARCVNGEWELAIADFTEAIGRDPNYARAYALRSVAYATRVTRKKRKMIVSTPRGLGLRQENWYVSWRCWSRPTRSL